ncbi:MAG: Proline iminopeptidase [Alphaproteobacteria bacterium ADurb.Bin438]|nr:MAG: Proline iminopeptidase [Alphaproteobacteria bacterium ADurb.Bin438]
MTKLLQSGFLKVSKIHNIYYETYGNPDGIPVIFVHGGPGGNFKSKNLIGLDTNKMFCILFDQRGCGKSTPSGEIIDNDTHKLVDDIKKLLDFLNVKQTCIYAGSWGACLSLLFAIKYPAMINKMFLNCSFLARKADSNFLYDGVKDIFPDLHSEFMKNIPEDKKNDISGYLFDEFETGNIERKKEIACLIANYEISLMKTTFHKSDDFNPAFMEDEDVYPSRMFLYYEANHFFIEDNYILKNADKLKDLDIFMTHGRYDMDAPLSGAWSLHKALPKSELVIVPYEGHSGDFKKSLLQHELNKFVK